MNAAEPDADGWCALGWSRWRPLRRGEFSTLDQGAGLYRIRVSGFRTLAYVGQTGSGMRQRLSDLCRHAMAEHMPFNDPHPAAPALWAWRDAAGYDYEYSVVATAIDRRIRMATACWLLWQHRLTSGASTLCNHGHFHAGYVKSCSQSPKRRGAVRAPEPGRIDLQMPSHSPLTALETPNSQHWMGLEWSPRHSLEVAPAGAFPALYRIFDAKTEKLLFIGESRNLGQCLRSQGRKNWSGRAPTVSFSRMPELTPKVHLDELATDLVGAYFEARRAAPELQFSVADRS